MTQGSKSYVDELLDMSGDPIQELPEFSEIAKFFAGTNVFVTGSTGFFGKLLVEKLLRSCPDIGTVFLMVRSKKGHSPEERFKKQFMDELYHRLRRERPNFESKIVMLEGDVSRENLGLSDESRKTLLTTNIIFHAAATVRFDESLRVATHVNVRGTKDILTFAREMPNLKAFVYISTAFSYCVLKHIEEKFYEPPFEPEKLLKLIEVLDDEKLELIKDKVIGKWPNTYAFTKAVTEDLVRQYSVGIPTCVVRPSIMIPTLSEPVPGWIDNLYGPTGVCVGAGTGVMHVLQADPQNIADIIPADFAINGTIAAAWETGIRGKIPAVIADSSSTSNISDIDRVPIYNLVSSCQNPIRWGEYMALNEIEGTLLPTTKAIWIYILKLAPNYYLYHLYCFLFHLVPAAIVDTVACLTGRKPILWKIYKKIHKFSGVISYFACQEWKFNNDTTLKLLSRLNAADRKMFDFNLNNFGWADYFYYHIIGIRRYLLNDPLSTVEEGIKRKFKLQIAHYTLVTISILLIFWLLTTFLSYMWSWCPLAN